MGGFTEEQLVAELLKLRNRDRWAGLVSMRDSPLRRALRRKGWIEGYRPKNLKVTRFRISAAGLERLVDVPGSGITRDIGLPF